MDSTQGYKYIVSVVCSAVEFPCPSLACRDETKVFDVVTVWPCVGFHSTNLT